MHRSLILHEAHQLLCGGTYDQNVFRIISKIVSFYRVPPGPGKSLNLKGANSGPWKSLKMKVVLESPRKVFEYDLSVLENFDWLEVCWTFFHVIVNAGNIVVSSLGYLLETMFSESCITAKFTCGRNKCVPGQMTACRLAVYWNVF